MSSVLPSTIHLLLVWAFSMSFMPEHQTSPVAGSFKVKVVICSLCSVVFTMPHELNRLARKYPKEMYNIPMRRSWQTIKAVCKNPEHVGGLPEARLTLDSPGSSALQLSAYLSIDYNKNSIFLGYNNPSLFFASTTIVQTLVTILKGFKGLMPPSLKCTYSGMI